MEVTTGPTSTQWTNALTGERGTCIGVFVNGELVAEHSSVTLASEHAARIRRALANLSGR